MASSSPDWSRVRRDFPILSAVTPSGRPVVYLDNAATSQKPRAVIDAITYYYEAENANVHRGMHHLAELATAKYEEARSTVARFLGAPKDAVVAWTRGTTESINLVAHAWGRHNLRPGDVILATRMEHHSNLVPWQMLAKEKDLVLRLVEIDSRGDLDLDTFRRHLADGRTRLAAFTHVSNALGTVNPVASMVEMARKAGVVSVVDGAQAVPHLPVDLGKLQPDFYAFSGHKACGPTGIGALVIAGPRVKEMQPFMGGGEMIHRVLPTYSTWAAAPLLFEAGTPHIEGAIGLAAALEYLGGIGMAAVHERINALTDLCVERLREVPGLRLIGEPRERGGAVSFVLGDVHPHDLSHVADQEGVALRAGHLCCQPLMDALGVSSVARASFSFINQEQDIDQLVAALHTTRRLFGHG